MIIDTINSLSDKCNSSQGEASEMARNSMRYDSEQLHKLNVPLGHYSNQVSTGTIETL